MNRIQLVLALACMVMACQSESNPVIHLDGRAEQEVSDLPAVELDQGELAKDVGPELLFDGVPHDLTVADLPPLCEPGTGCFMDPCQANDDCLSGLCVEYMGDNVCTVFCVEECPEGWECRQVGVSADVHFACVSPHWNLCRPCHKSADCMSVTGMEGSCVDYGSLGAFCGAECDPDAQCPSGFTCVDAGTVEGGAVKQCVAEAGICACSDTAVSLGLTTTCYVENDWGLCHGARFCGQEGLSDCDAAQPAPETCNGLDDDCDGETDEPPGERWESGICDDNDQCTVDACDPSLGCLNEPLSGSTCDDQDVCTLADHCDDGDCVGTKINCDDGNVCTTDSCDPAGGCVYGFNSAPCDDTDPCTVNDSCAQGDCQGFSVPCECKQNLDCVLLEDGDVCNGTLFCDADQFPQKCSIAPETIVACPEPEGFGAECLAASCHPVTGECGLVQANDGGPCDDGNACTVGASCADGACLAGVPVNCKDDNPCTTDFCDPDTGCQHEDNEAPCDDGNTCTVGDVCANGDCAPGTTLACSDSNPCTDDSCEPSAGCVHTANAAPCDDGNTCTTDDQCKNGACAGTGQLDCGDGNPCTNDLCQPDGGCAHENNSVPCDDGDPCSMNDQCGNGECVAGPPIDCNDGNPCTDDSCDEAGLCAHSPNDAACDDQNPCTKGDQCLDGGCAAPVLLDCDDGNLCTTDWCDPAVGCAHEDNTLPCDDGNTCTAGETCLAGACLGGKEINCNDGNLCTDDDCHPQKGCLNTTNSLPCNDADACTTGDVCDQGDCMGQGETNCNDGNPCTDDLCDPVAGCKHIFNDAECNDGNPCTTSDACQAGSCVGTGGLDCSDDNLCTDDSCNPNVGCVHTNNQVPCNDQDVCSFDDTCTAGVCAPSGFLDCDDGNPCTDDSCHAQSGCANTPNSAPCDDNNLCTSEDVCAAGGCQGGAAPDCSDENPCTIDVCLWDSGCEHLPAPAGSANGLCRECDGLGGFQAASDDDDCGLIECSELDHYFTEGEPTPANINYCMQRQYQALFADRCEGIDDCKDENTEDCTEFQEVVAATCGVCRFAEGACTECTTYADGTQCAAGKACEAGACIADQFGTGSQGNLVVSGSGTVVNHYAYVIVPLVEAGSGVVPINDATHFSTGDEVMVLQVQHTESPGTYEFGYVESVEGNTLNLAEPLASTYASSSFDTVDASAAQVIRVPHFADVTVSPGASIAAPAWSGYIGGVAVFRVSGTLTVNGAITVSGLGFRGGPHHNDNSHGKQGESTVGLGTQSYMANGGGGGGGQWAVWNGGDTISGSGGGGGHGTSGTNGTTCATANAGAGGGAYGTPEMTTLFLGSGGGAAGDEDRSSPGGPAGGRGGGLLMAFAKVITVPGSVTANGADGSGNTEWDSGVSAAGAGGSIRVYANDVTIGGTVEALGGAGGSTSNWCGANKGGNGGNGRIRLDTKTLNGTTDPPHYEP